MSNPGNINASDVVAAIQAGDFARLNAEQIGKFAGEDRERVVRALESYQGENKGKVAELLREVEGGGGSGSGTTLGDRSLEATKPSRESALESHLHPGTRKGKWIAPIDIKVPEDKKESFGVEDLKNLLKDYAPTDRELNLDLSECSIKSEHFTALKEFFAPKEDESAKYPKLRELYLQRSIKEIAAWDEFLDLTMSEAGRNLRVLDLSGNTAFGWVLGELQRRGLLEQIQPLPLEKLDLRSSGGPHSSPEGFKALIKKLPNLTHLGLSYSYDENATSNMLSNLVEVMREHSAPRIRNIDLRVSGLGNVPRLREFITTTLEINPGQTLEICIGRATGISSDDKKALKKEFGDRLILNPSPDGDFLADSLHDKEKAGYEARLAQSREFLEKLEAGLTSSKEKRDYILKNPSATNQTILKALDEHIQKLEDLCQETKTLIEKIKQTLNDFK